ncbi:hypothetical protein [Mesonia sp. HuA40]|uniref:hypothetical protein n=1 Tax=Mesonia sp. HuA40 TaxID=2602761 RepID=UPI0011CCA456|nr:hypothetical protein [Mesonia sp. HuA40]TXK70879.1 hypothetical protein FT993_09840 [Mesonia sp. HuA40]
MKKISFLFVLICSIVNGQSIKELYTEKFQSDWKVYEDKNYVKKYIDTNIVYKLKSGRTPEQELLFQAKENHNKRAERLSQIFSSLKVELEATDSLAFIEQRSTNINFEGNYVNKGAIITNDTIYGFIYDYSKENFKIENHNYFQHSENETIHQAKQVIGNLILANKTNYLDSIAKVESAMFANSFKDISPETEFEILIYNKTKNNDLRRFYLHETFIYVMNYAKEKNKPEHNDN